MNYLDGFLGSKTTINSRTWGTITAESASFTPATDGDLIVHIGNPFAQPAPLVRIHSECVFAERFDSDLCDCAEQFRLAMTRLTSEGHGILFYLRFDGRGAGLAAKVKATALEVSGVDTYDSRVSIGVSPEARHFTAIGQYLIANGVTRVRLLTNNPLKVEELMGAGISVEGQPLLVEDPNEKVRQLYKTKATKFQHDIPDVLR